MTIWITFCFLKKKNKNQIIFNLIITSYNSRDQSMLQTYVWNSWDKCIANCYTQNFSKTTNRINLQDFNIILPSTCIYIYTHSQFHSWVLLSWNYCCGISRINLPLQILFWILCNYIVQLLAIYLLSNLFRKYLFLNKLETNHRFNNILKSL